MWEIDRPRNKTHPSDLDAYCDQYHRELRNFGAAETMRKLRFRNDRLIALLLQARSSKNSVAYSVAIIAVIGLTLLRLLSGTELIAGLPFTTYFPAIALTALLGGFGPGVVATLLVSIIAWYPTFPDGLDARAATWFLLMVLVTAVNILVVALLSATVEVTINRRRQQEPAE